MSVRIYQSPGLQSDILVDVLCAWFRDHNYETRCFWHESGHFVLQVSQNDLWRTILGVQIGLTLEVYVLSPEKIEIHIGSGVVAGLGVLSLFLMPLVLWQQAQLDRRIWEVIEGNLPTMTEQVILLPSAPTRTDPLPTDWFNAETGEVYSTHFFERMDSWQQAMADGIIEPAEVEAQSELVRALLHTLEQSLDDSTHSQVGEVFGELAVLQGMQSFELVHRLSRLS
jgi:hypothetical protein